MSQQYYTTKIRHKTMSRHKHCHVTNITQCHVTNNVTLQISHKQCHVTNNVTSQTMSRHHQYFITNNVTQIMSRHNVMSQCHVTNNVTSPPAAPLTRDRLEQHHGGRLVPVVAGLQPQEPRVRRARGGSHHRAAGASHHAVRRLLRRWVLTWCRKCEGDWVKRP